jgi:Glyoxalase/Bleomycin resistance protein/Dioxygenase superfamily
MSLVSFGQPDDGVVQIAYVVKDIQKAMRQWAEDLKIGPWFLLPGFRGVEPLYRGRPSEMEADLAMSFAGHMNIELIQQRNDAPSVYRDLLGDGQGFHHWGIATRDFDRELEKYKKKGDELAFFSKVPSGGRVGYLDTKGRLPGMIELIELGADFEATFNRFYRASIGWDGQDPVRPFV